MAVARRERFEVLYNYTPQTWDELELSVGDTIQVVEKYSDGWMLGVSEKTSKAGKCPGNFLQKLVKTTVERALPKPLEKSSSDIKGESNKKRSNIAEEILSTERSYVKNLHLLRDQYYEPLKKKTLLKPEELTAIFSNVQSLYGVNETLLKELEARMTSWDAATTQIGDVFLQLAPFLKLYETYCNQHANACEILARCQSKSDTFNSFLKTTAASCLQTLDSLLLMPIQRIPRYNLLLEDLLRYTTVDHPDVQNLSNAVVSMRKIASDLNENIRRIENERKIIAIGQLFPNENVDLVDANRQFLGKKTEKKQRRLSKGVADERPRVLTADLIPTPNEVAPAASGPLARTYLREGTLLKIKINSLKTVDTYFFLFNDLMLVSRQKNNVYKLKERAMLAHCWINDSPVDSEKVFFFGTPQNTYQLAASSAEEKARWFADISKCISAQKELLTKYVASLSARESFGVGYKLKAIVDYTGSQNVEISFKADDIVIYTPHVYETVQVPEDWGQGLVNGVFGWFPLACVVRSVPEHDPSMADEYQLTINDMFAIRDKLQKFKSAGPHGTTVDGTPRTQTVLKIYEMDGSYKSVVVSIGSTTKEAIAALFERYKRTDNPADFDIYESSTADAATERKLDDGESIADVAAQWTTQTLNFKFTIRRK